MKESSNYYHLKLTFFLSLLAWPITYIFNNGFNSIDENVRTFWMMFSGFLILSTVSYVAYKASRNQNWLYFGFTCFAFGAVIDLIINLEFLGLIKGFMSEYLKIGEPYLFSPWGSAICIFDGIGFYTMYLILVHRCSNGKSWRSMGLYWAAGILNSMIVLMTGIFTGRHSPTYCTFLNAPFVILPIIVVMRIFGKEKRADWSNVIKKAALTKLVDIFFMIGFSAAIWIVISKAFFLLGSEFEIIRKTMRTETALRFNEPAPFAPIQILTFFFYILPIQLATLFYLFREEKPQFLWEANIINAGAMLEAQFSYILYSMDPQTPANLRVDFYNSEFWFINLLILVVPHLFIWRLYLHRRRVNKSSSKKN